MIDPKDVALLNSGDRLAQLRADKEMRDRARAEQAKAREIEALELEAKYEAELGPRGVKWEMHSNAVGNFVVRLGDTVAYKRFLGVDEKVRSEEDAAQLVTAYVVHPGRTEYLAAAGQHGGIHWQLALAMLQLYEAKGAQTAGK